MESIKGVALPNKYITKSINKESTRHLADVEETAPEALKVKTSHPSALSFTSLLSALIDVRVEDQRLLNSSNQEDREIEQEGGVRRQCVCVCVWARWDSVHQSTPRNDLLTAGLSQTFGSPESKRIHSFSCDPSLHIHLSPSLLSLPPLSFLLCVPSWRGGAGPSTINLLSNNTGNVTHYWKEMGKMNQ